MEGRCITSEELAEERAGLSAEDRAKLDALPQGPMEDLGQNITTHFATGKPYPTSQPYPSLARFAEAHANLQRPC